MIKHLVFQPSNSCSIYLICIWCLKMKCRPLDCTHIDLKIIHFGFKMKKKCPHKVGLVKFVKNIASDTW